MALNINGRMKVKTLKTDFKKEFGLNLRIYVGVNFADEDATLASIRKGDSKGGEFAPQRNTKIGNLEEKIMDMFGIKTQVSGSDDSYLCKDELTLKAALEADEKRMIKKSKKKEKLMKNAENSQATMSIADIISELKITYGDHEDLEEMISDLEDDGYYDYWAEKLCTEDFNKNLELAKPLYEIAVEKVEGSSDLLTIANYIKDPDGFNDEGWGNKLLKIALENAEDYNDFQCLANDFALTNKDKARELYQKAIDTASTPFNHHSIAASIEEYLGDSQWAEKIKETTPLPIKTKSKFQILYSKLIDRKNEVYERDANLGDALDEAEGEVLEIHDLSSIFDEEGIDCLDEVYDLSRFSEEEKLVILKTHAEELEKTTEQTFLDIFREDEANN